MLPEFQTVLSYFEMQASIFQTDYEDILGMETLQLVERFINAASNLCQKVSRSSSASLEPSQSQSALELELDREVELPEVVLEFHRWAQGPHPSWLQEFEQVHSKLRLVAASSGSSVMETDPRFEKYCSNAPKQAASESSVTETDTEFEFFRLNPSKRGASSESSVTEMDTEFERFRSNAAASSESSVTETDTEFEHFRLNAAASSKSSVTETDTEFEIFCSNASKRAAASESSVTETDSEFERLHSNSHKRAAASGSSVTETDSEFERLHSNSHKRAAASGSSVTETDSEFERLHSNSHKRAASEASVTEPDELEQIRPNIPRPVASPFSATETDTDSSVTDAEYSYRAAPASFTATIRQLVDQLYDLRSSASGTVQELRALASGAEFCCTAFLFMLVFIRQNGLNTCRPEHKADYNRAIKLSARHLFEALEDLQAFVTDLQYALCPSTSYSCDD